MRPALPAARSAEGEFSSRLRTGVASTPCQEIGVGLHVLVSPGVYRTTRSMKWSSWRFNGIIALLQEHASFNWHRKEAFALRGHPHSGESYSSFLARVTPSFERLVITALA